MPEVNAQQISQGGNVVSGVIGMAGALISLAISATFCALYSKWVNELDSATHMCVAVRGEEEVDVLARF